MKRIIYSAVFLLTSSTVAFAQVPPVPGPVDAPVEAPPMAAPAPMQGFVAPPMAAPATDGLPGPENFIVAPEIEVFSPSNNGAGPMAPFYRMPTYQYTGWYRPRAVERDTAVRCQPTDFRPRGFGNLFARTPSNRRLDYAPYKLANWQTPYGPAYYELPPDQRCQGNCAHGACLFGTCGPTGCQNGTCGGLFDKLAFGRGGACDACNSGSGMKVFTIASRRDASCTDSCGANTGCTTR